MLSPLLLATRLSLSFYRKFLLSGRPTEDRYLLALSGLIRPARITRVTSPFNLGLIRRVIRNCLCRCPPNVPSKLHETAPAQFVDATCCTDFRRASMCIRIYVHAGCICIRNCIRKSVHTHTHTPGDSRAWRPVKIINFSLNSAYVMRKLSWRRIVKWIAFVLLYRFHEHINSCVLSHV